MGTGGLVFLDPTRQVLTYTADGASPADSFTYTVSDPHGGSVTGTMDLAVSGAAANATTLVGTAGTDTLTAAKAGQTLLGGGGNDTLNANASGTTVFAGGGMTR